MNAKSIQLALVLLGFSSTGCEDKKPPPKELIRPVRVVRVAVSGGPRARKFSGTSRSGTTSLLSFKVSGTIRELRVKVGDKIDKGQLIAKLDPKDFELQVQEARAALTLARAQQRNAKSAYDRVRALYENRNASKSELDVARTSYETTNANVSSVSKRLQLARRQLDYTQLKSPSKGSIAQLSAEINENVTAGKPIVTLTAGADLEVKIEVPEGLIAMISKGSPANVRFDAVDKQTYEATVTEVGIAPVGGATTFPVMVKLKNPTSKIRPGLAAEVEFQFAPSEERERIVLPPVAVGADHQGKFVFVVTGDEGTVGKVERVPVEVGELSTEGLEIKKGVQAGQLVVTAGISRIKHNQKVKIPKAKN